MNEYLKKNCKKSDWFNAITRNRLGNLKGKIQKLDQKEYTLNESRTTLELTSGTPNFTLFFNKEFQIIEERENVGQSVITYKNFIEDRIREQKWFDDNGSLVQIEIYDYSDDSSFPINFYTKKIDGSENRIALNLEIIDEHSFVYHGRYFNELYTHNKLVEMKANYNNLKFKYEYFETHHIQYRYFDDFLNDLEIFDHEGYLVERITNNRNGAVIYKENRKYDALHNLIELNTNDLEIDYQTTTIFTYNKQSNLIEEKRLSKELIVFELTQYEYDSYGNCKREKGDDSKNIEIKYVYDYVGNWVEKLKVKESKVFNRVIREIEYFD